MKRLIVFDLDGTLAKSKSPLDAEMSGLFHTLLGIVKVAVISGGAWPQFEAQVLAMLPHDERLTELSLLPTCGTKFFAYDGAWKELYSEDLGADDKTTIVHALKTALEQSGFQEREVWGDIIEDRGSQITLSALGQQAPLDAKARWDPDFAKRKRMSVLDAALPNFSVRLGGTTSIDVTRLGIDKAYGIAKLRKVLAISVKEMLFVGDALFVGGNDHPAEEAGVPSIQVRDPDETKRVIEALVACLESPVNRGTDRASNSGMKVPSKLSHEEVRTRLHTLPGWALRGGKLHREYEFGGFAEAFGFMSTCALVSQKQDHHPEWFNVFNRVVVDLTTDDAGGISALDFALAAEMEKAARLPTE